MQPLSAPERPVHARVEWRDPAPSRLAYRMERLWLTPVFRLMMRVGLPVVLIGAGLAVWLADADHRRGIAETYAGLRRQIEDRPEFQVRLMSVEGASEPVAQAIRAMLPVTLPASSFVLDIAALRATVAQIDAVETVEVRIRSGVLEVVVRERSPAILWRGTNGNEQGLEMLDAGGHRVATLLDREARPDLPVIAGEGADLHVPEALALLDAARPVHDRLRGLVRIGERRWDMVLDRDLRILLPEIGPVPAMQRVMALHEAQDLLSRDIMVVDMRNENRPTVRIAGPVPGDEETAGAEEKVAGQ